MAFAEINGYGMHYEVFGADDAPVMAMIHGGLGGGDGSRDTINRQAAALTEEYRCVFYDRRACGQSDTPAEGYDIPNCARDLRMLLEHLGIEKGAYSRLVGRGSDCDAVCAGLPGADGYADTGQHDDLFTGRRSGRCGVRSCVG